MSAKPLNTYGYGARAAQRCRSLSRPPYSEVEDALCRRYLTTAHRATLDRIREWMAAAGMAVREDAIATLIGRYEGQHASAPAVLIGSHVDSVPDGGAYDGMLGVLLGLACVEILHREQIRLPFAVEIVAFGDEEGSRFHTTMNGSRAMAGHWDPKVLVDRDSDGTTLAEAYAAFGVQGRPEDVVLTPQDYIGFIEPHIEQGPVLEARERALGVVDSIAGQKRLAITFNGSADHAGTTPMELRRDALAAACEAVLATEEGGLHADGVVATVGKIEAFPGTPNVIPGEVRFFVDIRSGDDALRDTTLASLEDRFHGIARRRHVQLAIETVQTLPAASLDENLSNLVLRAISETQPGEPLRLLSGAGHDAMMLTKRIASTMLFIRCAGGLSHHPDESVSDSDCEAALGALLRTMRLLEQERENE